MSKSIKAKHTMSLETFIYEGDERYVVIASVNKQGQFLSLVILPVVNIYPRDQRGLAQAILFRLRKALKWLSREI